VVQEVRRDIPREPIVVERLSVQAIPKIVRRVASRLPRGIARLPVENGLAQLVRVELEVLGRWREITRGDAPQPRDHASFC